MSKNIDQAQAQAIEKLLSEGPAATMADVREVVDDATEKNSVRIPPEILAGIKNRAECGVYGDDMMSLEDMRTMRAAIVQRTRCAEIFVIKIQQSRGALDSAHAALYALVSEMAGWGRRQIESDTDLVNALRRIPFGVQRRKSIAWIEKFTRVVVKFETRKGEDGKPVRTNSIKGIALTKSKSKEWDLDGAKVTPILEVAASRKGSKDIAKPDLARGLAAFIREAARAMDGEGMPLEEIKRVVESQLVKGLAENLSGERSNDKHGEWVSNYADQKTRKTRES